MCESVPAFYQERLFETDGSRWALKVVVCSDFFNNLCHRLLSIMACPWVFLYSVDVLIAFTPLRESVSHRLAAKPVQRVLAGTRLRSSFIEC